MLKNIMAAVGRAVFWAVNKTVEIALVPVHAMLMQFFPATYEPLPDVAELDGSKLRFTALRSIRTRGGGRCNERDAGEFGDGVGCGNRAFRGKIASSGREAGGSSVAGFTVGRRA